MTLAFCGCNSSDLVRVSGLVTLDGVPVSSGRVEFFPDSGRPAVGDIDAQGNYNLFTLKPGDGVLPGKYKVAVTSRTVTGGGGPPPMKLRDEIEQLDTTGSVGQAGTQPVRFKWNIPEKYSHRDASELSADVGQDGGEIDFELVSTR